MVEYDPFSARAMSDPLPLYRELRDAHPVYPLPQYDGFAVSRFEDVWSAIGTAQGLSLVEGPVFLPEAVERPFDPQRLPPFDAVRSFASWDPPVHTQLRKSIRGFFGPGASRRLEPLARRLARERLEALLPAGRFDVVRDYAAHVAVGVSCAALGVPAEEGPRLVELSNRSQRRAEGRAGMTEEGFAAQAEIFQHMLACVAARRRRSSGEPRVVDALLACELDGVAASDEAVATQLVTLLVGGTETVPKITAGGVVELARAADQRRALIEDPTRAGGAWEEMVRHQGVLQFVGRTALREMEVAGQRVMRGQRLFLLLQSANRDEREFEAPDRFDIARRPRRHLGFGRGPHHCPGAHLARVEGRVLIQELLARAPDWEVDVDGVERPPSDFQLGYVALPIRL